MPVAYVVTTNPAAVSPNLPPQELSLSSSVFLSDADAVLTRSQTWWSDFYPYRRPLSLAAPPSGLEANHPVSVSIPKSILVQNKVRPDLQDIEVLYLVSSAPERWKALSKEKTTSDVSYVITFNTVGILAPGEVSTDRYFVYYGNKLLKNVPFLRTYVYEAYPVTVEYNEAGISYTKAGDWWIDGVSRVTGAKATFTFYGDQVRYVADIGADYGIAEIQIDDSAWEQVDLYSSTAGDPEGEIVYTKTGLDTSKHTLRIRVSGQKNASSSSAAINLMKIQYKKTALALDTGEEVDDTMLWGSVYGGAF